MQEMISPTVAAISPLTVSPSERLAAMKTPKMPNQNISQGPNIIESLTKKGIVARSMMIPRLLPMKLVKTLMPRATSASPLFVNW
jgi:hypothetical protein